MLPATISWLAALTVWPDAVGSDVHDRLADDVEKRLGCGEILGRSADHDRQRGVLGARFAARHRCVENPQAVLGAGVGQLFSDIRPDAGEVDHQGARLGMGENSVVAEQHVLDVGGVGHHDRHDVGVLDRLFGRVGGLTALVDQGGDAFRRVVAADDGVPGSDQMGCHWAAHDAQSDESDCAHWILVSACGCGKSGGDALRTALGRGSQSNVSGLVALYSRPTYPA